jgi:hypothetical protein
VERALRARCHHGGEAANRSIEGAERSIHLLSLDQLRELRKEVAGIVRCSHVVGWVFEGDGRDAVHSNRSNAALDSAFKA